MELLPEVGGHEDDDDEDDKQHSGEDVAHKATDRQPSWLLKVIRELDQLSHDGVGAEVVGDAGGAVLVNGLG